MREIKNRVIKIVMCITIMFSIFMVPTKAAVTNTEIVNYAKQYVGYRYVYGTKGPTTFDCSGFVYYVFHHFGLMETYNNSYTFFNSPTSFGTVVSELEAKPGDIIAWKEHMGIYIGEGKCINALNEDDGVCIINVAGLIDSTGKQNPSHKYIRMNYRIGSVQPEENVTVTLNEAPTIKGVKVTNITSKGYDLSCTVSDDKEVSSVKVKTYNTLSYASKPKTVNMVKNGTTYTYHVDTTNFNKENNCGYYNTIVAKDNEGATKEYTTKMVSVGAMSASLSKTTFVYNGSAKNPTVTVTDCLGNVLVKDTNYTVTYSKGRINPGKYSVTITGKGKYSFSKTLSFKVNPKGTSITSIVGKRGEVDVKWHAQTIQMSGYQLRISKNKDFSTKLTFNVKKTNNHEEVIGLMRKHRYYVKVRTYKTVNGTKYYSAWSAVKNTVTK